MSKQLLCLGTNEQFGVPCEEQIQLFADAGFNAFFTAWKQGYPIENWRKTGEKAGLVYQSVHAPFGGCADMWRNDECEAEKAVNELVDCVHACSVNYVPIMISHTYIGFDEHPAVSSVGLKRYERVVREAEKCGVKIAFENTEGEEFLAALLNEFNGCSSVGFCLDTGHAMCYNFGTDLLSLYGDRLIATHLNDNLGVKDLNGKITWHDDLHLLPFDGIADWNKITDGLNAHGYNGILTFELNTASKPNRHENDAYALMPLKVYLAECYKRASRVAAKMSGGYLY